MNIGTRLLISAALAAGATIGAAALGTVRDAPSELTAQSAAVSGGSALTDPGGGSTAEGGAAESGTGEIGSLGTPAVSVHAAGIGGASAGAVPADSEARVQGVRAELLAAAQAGDISWEAAQRVGDDLGAYIRGERDASVIV